MPEVHALQLLRYQHWRQTPETRIAAPEAALPLIERLGVVTLFPASPEIPNLFHAYTGDPAARTESGWESPSGEVYGWRWALGRREAGFYTAIVRGRPTWVAWGLLPALLRLRGELRSPEALYQAGELSEAALRVARALADAGGVLSTGMLRQIADFPTGKAQRAAYLKAVDELDTRLMLAKVFAPGDLDMRHALVSLRYPEAVQQAEQLGRDEALDRFLELYLPAAVYAAPTVLARNLRLPEPELRAGCERLVAQGRAAAATLEGYRGQCYIWQAA